MSEPTWELLGGGGAIGGPIDYVGDWAAGTTYQPGQVVRYGGIDYLAVNPSLGQTPPLASPVPTAMVCLFDQVLAAPAAQFDLLSIPSGYAALWGVLNARFDGAVTQGFVLARFNNDVAANYITGRLENTSGTTVAASENMAATSMVVGRCAGASAPAGMVGSQEFVIPDHANALFHKLLIAHGIVICGTATGNWTDNPVGSSWRNTAAVTRLTIFPQSGNFIAGSRLTLYGLRGLA